jgi:hypothetical protein
MKKIILILVMTVCLVGMTSALDIVSFPDVIEPGSFMISPGMKFGFYYGAILGSTIGVDYALDIGIPLTVGGETGIIIPITSKVLVMPIMARAAYHLDLGVTNLDPYIMLKAGFTFGFLTESNASTTNTVAIGGFSFGADVGCRYFFNNRIAMFFEGGYDYYPITNYRYLSYVQTFLTAGITVKF